MKTIKTLSKRQMIFNMLSLFVIVSLLTFGGGSNVDAKGYVGKPSSPGSTGGQGVDHCLGGQVAYQALTGKVSFAGSSPNKPIKQPVAGLRSASPEAAARGYLSQCGKLFGVSDQASELGVMRQNKVKDGRSVLRFQQAYRGIPVFGGELVVQLNAANDIVMVNGEMLPSIKLNTQASVEASTAQQTALKAVADEHKVSSKNLKAGKAQLWVYSPVLLHKAGPTSLVWRMDVTPVNIAPLRELVLVDAHSGAVVLKFNQVDDALNRLTYDLAGDITVPGGTLVCDESNPDCTGGDTDAVNAHVYAGDTYNFYASNFGRDSIDNAGMTLSSYVHYDTGYCNAAWDGYEMIYGDGCFIVADDVVGHELTHGVTQYTSNLNYIDQSGAINESMSDIFGEFVDLTNGHGNDDPSVRWQLGEDTTGGSWGNGALRDMKTPSLFDQPDRMGSPLYYNGYDDNGGVHTNSGVGNKAAYLITDGDTFNGYTVTGIGIAKAAQIYYEAQTNILTSTSDYYALYNALFQACTNLIGGSSGITDSDCTQVQNATLATEMNLYPPPAPPANDDFDSPEPVSTLPYSNFENTAGATTASDDPILSCAYQANDPRFNTVWYSYTPGVSQTLTIDTFGSDFDTVLAVWTGGRGALDPVACNDDFDATSHNYQSQVKVAVTAGVSYFIEVASYGSGGSLELNVAELTPPTNDDFDTPELISNNPYSTTQDASSATTAVDDPVLPCLADQGYGTVWYSYTAAASQNVTFDTFGSNYDTVLGVWTGSRGALVSVGCNDQSLGNQSEVTIAATTGVTYSIEVASSAPAAGSLTLNMTIPVPTSWVVKSSMGLAVDRLAAAVVGGKIYVIGGESAMFGSPSRGTGVSINRENRIEQFWETMVQEYDPATDSWTPKATKPTGVSNIGAATLNGKIYVPGGYDGYEAVSSVEVYNPVANTWSSVAPLPVPQLAQAVATVNGKLYVIGGSDDSNNMLNTCYVYIPAADHWSTCAAMTYARGYAGVGVINNKIYVVGGIDSSDNDLDYVEEYNPVTNTWTTKAPLGTARGGAGVVAYGSFLYACGGGWYAYLDSCEKYNPAVADHWSVFDHLNFGRRTLAMVEANGRLYAEGGYNGDYMWVNEENASLPVPAPTVTPTATQTPTATPTVPPIPTNTSTPVPTATPTAAPVTLTLPSAGARDGWILESSETSTKGGTMNAKAKIFQLGDDAFNRQYRAVLSFDTSGLPDNANILSAVLMIKQSGAVVGKNPFNVLGKLLVDIRKGWFGSTAALQLGDFNGAASANKVGNFSKTPVAGWYSAPLNNVGLNNINRTGLTQLRLRFTLDDNNDHRANYMKFVSGNTASGQPVLVITYIVR